jgi:hypothetical protein
MRLTGQLGAFSPAVERVRQNVHRHAVADRPSGEKARGQADNAKQPAGPAERRARSALAGYPSPVCSSRGDAIDRVAAAIDQLASDARDPDGTMLDGELATRIATLWQMLSDLDPELARRARRYAAPADGAPLS